jgi:hypothetical protein
MNRRAATAFAVFFLVAGCGSGTPTSTGPNPPPPPSSAPSPGPSSVPATLEQTESYPPWLTVAPASSYLSESSSATNVSLPADGEYICISKEFAICSDQGGEATAVTLTSDDETNQTPSSGVTDFDPTISMAAGTVYFRREQRTVTSPIETIARVSVHGGSSATIITAPAQNGDENTGLGSPQISPDGRFLAYTLTVGQVNLPSSAIPAPTGTYAPLGSHIFILDVGKGATVPLVVPSTITGAELPDAFDGYQLVGWSTDDKTLYYFGGPSRTLRALTFNAAEQPAASKVVFQPAATQSPCPDSPAGSAVSQTGDAYFTTYCQQAAFTIERLHNGQVSTYATIPELVGGWLVSDVHVDTTGRYVQLDAVPLGTNCLGGSAYVAFLDGVVIAKQIQTNPYGCPPPTRP